MVLHAISVSASKAALTWFRKSVSISARPIYPPRYRPLAPNGGIAGEGSDSGRAPKAGSGAFSFAELVCLFYCVI